MIANGHRYLPIGIGLFQAQNQQLLIVSREQSLLLRKEEHYKPLYPAQGKGLGGPRYWLWRLKLWWQGTSTQGKYEGFVLIGMTVQVSDEAPQLQVLPYVGHEHQLKQDA